MRTVVLVVVVAAVAPFHAAHAGPLDAVGVLWGSAWTSMTVEDDRYERDGIWGLALGGYADWRLPWDRWRVATEFYYVERGFARETVDHSAGSVEPASLPYVDEYLSIPVLAKFVLTEGQAPLFVFGGPSFDYRLRRFYRSTDSRREPGRWSTSMQLGAGVHWRALEGQCRYVFGLGSSSVSGPGGITRSSGFGGLELRGGLRFAR
jgi:hypothetical protein